MSYAGAIARLKLLTFTGLQNSYDARNNPLHTNELPALIIDDDASQPFVDGLAVWNVNATKANLTTFIDHILLIEPISNADIETRYTNRATYLERYAAAITGDMLLNNNLAVPLQIIVVRRGKVYMRKRIYSGIIFRHKWQIRIS